MKNKPKPDLSRIKLLVVDVDGVMTNGSISIDSHGNESKTFNLLDGHGIRMWKRAGMKIAFLSGRSSEPTRYRAEQLEIDHCLQRCYYKLPALQELLKEINVLPEETAYMGDDLMDLPPVRHVGFGVAVANGVDELKEYADYITNKPGGGGAVREVIEYILKSVGKWDELMQRYLA